MARAPCAGSGRAKDDRNGPTAREGVFPQGRQPNAGADRLGGVRRTTRPGRRFRTRSHRAQAGGRVFAQDADGAGAREPRRHHGPAYGLDYSRNQTALTATVTNAQAALRWLGRRPPDLEEVRQALGRIEEVGHRAGDVVARIRALIQKAPPRKDRLDLNAAIREVIQLTRGEAVKNGVSVQAQLADGLPLIHGDRVQLQQVVLNLIINGVEAMSGVSEGARDLLVSTGKAEPGGVLVAVMDSGPGLASAHLDRLFDAFYTTKPSGLGMGLSICRSIIDAHGGRLWASANVPQGAILQFVLPAHPVGAS